ncbi:MAG: GNAT superfamily N-acetyltransferase [Kiritimatiellia bacterium]
MTIQRLDHRHTEAIIECLEADIVQNLFLLSLLELYPLPMASWYGVVDGERVIAVLVVMADQLAVPWSPDVQLARELGQHVRGHHTPCMMVGPRAAVDAIWTVWGKGIATECFFDQRLYVCSEQPTHSDPALRLARVEETALISTRSASMEREDLGKNLAGSDVEQHERVVRSRIEQGKTMVLDDAGQVLFQLNLGSSSHYGCQVGGTFVPSAHRGKGIATRGMRACLHQLLKTHPLATLHVNEANLPAVRCYERSGFVRHAPYRLLTLAT